MHCHKGENSYVDWTGNNNNNNNNGTDAPTKQTICFKFTACYLSLFIIIIIITALIRETSYFYI